MSGSRPPAQQNRQKRPPRRAARQAALSLLAKRLRSEQEVRSRLHRMGYDSCEVDDAVALVKDYGYLDDRAFVEAVQREARRTGRGPLWIGRTLRARGIDEQLSDRAEQSSIGQAETNARAVLERYFGSPSELSPKERRRAYRLLLSRGFPTDCAWHVLGEDM